MTQPSSYALGDLLDIPRLQDLFDSLNDAFSFPSAVIDRDGDILTATAWQDVCTRFHRVHPECEAQCRESDRHLERHLDEADPAIVYYCPRGLVEAATPVIVGGEHLGTVFMGQLFVEAPDLGFFREQAARFGFDEAAYLDAVARVPVLTREHLDRCLAVLRRFAETFGGMALDVIRQREATDAAAEGAEFSRQVVAGAQEGIVVYDPGMRLEAWNPYMERLTGVPAGDVLGRPALEVFPFLKESGSVAAFELALTGEASEANEFPFKVPATGRSGWASVSHAPLRDAVGDIVGVIATVDQITEAKRAGERLRAAEREAVDAAARMRKTVEGAVAAMGVLVETRDPYTAGHERRVTQLAVALASELEIDGEILETLRLAGEVHDIGKVAVPAEILTKPGRLSPTEFAIIKVHPVAGADILASVDFGLPVADIVRWHHERLDGSGYPDGLDGEAIPLEARILAVADVVEAMASHRPYRPALGVAAALDEVRGGGGRLYDAAVAAACERVFAAGFAFSD